MQKLHQSTATKALGAKLARLISGVRSGGLAGADVGGGIRRDRFGMALLYFCLILGFMLFLQTA